MNNTQRIDTKEDAEAVLMEHRGVHRLVRNFGVVNTLLTVPAMGWPLMLVWLYSSPIADGAVIGSMVLGILVPLVRLREMALNSETEMTKWAKNRRGATVLIFVAALLALIPVAGPYLAAPLIFATTTHNASILWLLSHRRVVTLRGIRLTYRELAVAKWGEPPPKPKS